MTTQNPNTATELAKPQASSTDSAPLGSFALMTPAMAAHLCGLTPARVGMRQTGVSIATGDLLDFQLAHARARDAVHNGLQPASLLAELRALPMAGASCESGPILLHSAAKDRQTYLQRPDLGRRLDDASRDRLRVYAEGNQHPCFDLAIVIADGLSALAVERHAVPLLAELLPALHESGLRLAPVCIVEQGRVAVADEVADALGAAMAIMLIGERPGLSSPDSLGAYITWQPRPSVTTDAERNCISNIRTEGLGYSQAAARLLYYIGEARAKQLTGVALKDPDAALETKSVQMLEPGSQHGDRR